MGDNGTRHSQRAAAGLSKAIRRDYVRPDTQIVGPDGTVRYLGRRNESVDPVMAFHKYNPARRDARTGKRPKPGAAAAGAAATARRGGVKDVAFGRSARNDDADGGPLGGLLRGPRDLVNRIPFMHLAITAALAHRVWCFVTRRFFGSSDAAAAAARENGNRQLATRAANGEEEEYDDDEYDLDERTEELLAQMQHASMLPTMLRASLPRSHRTSLAKRAAQQYHSRPRGYRTAHQMMHGGPAPATANGAGGSGGRQAAGGSGRRQAQRRPLGKLEKMDLIVRQQVRAAMLAQQQQQEQRLHQQLGALEPGPAAAARLALPGPAVAPGAASSSSALSTGQCGPPPPQASTSGPLVPAAAATGALPPAPPHWLQAGPPPPPPPAFRALPPELRARFQGMRHPGAAALAPAVRAAAAGPPPVGLQEAQAAPGVSGSSGATTAAASGSAASGSGAGAAVQGPGEASGRGHGDMDAAAAGMVAAGEGDSEGAEVRLAVPRVARGVRFARKAVGQENEGET
ncbi:hypothetical protein PLESTB_001141100 [Pleodorina starrii]|uniref:Uncharacterized protein n=1 Tax=Pleodorina starrii TaxID=330485 RepID=A0A9W6F592_9CHLO|nr:hypothetical protein PLESTM_000563500 [Pleodorina starrii]GLC56744.1 hypothetical protein PLESTB_001141100 [Pleodorina starrii]GLC66900.1 hypothetical protein PLESTF_000488400 [Pleodorina starrii]